MKKWNLKHSVLALSILAYCVLSCKDKVNPEVKIIVENNIGKKFIIPDSLIAYNPFTNYIADSIGISNASFKIYSKINASCGTCISKINNWNKIANEFKKYGVPVILICQSDENFELIKYFCESGEIESFPYPFFIDKRNELTELNDFMKKVVGFETVLTNRENKIIALGDPLRFEKIKKIYLDEIKKNSSY